MDVQLFSFSFGLRSLLFIFLFTPFLAHAADGAPGSEGRFLANARQLVYEGRRSGEGYFDREGKRLIFQSEREEGKLGDSFGQGTPPYKSEIRFL